MYPQKVFRCEMPHLIAFTTPAQVFVHARPLAHVDVVHHLPHYRESGSGAAEEEEEEEETDGAHTREVTQLGPTMLRVIFDEPLIHPVVSSYVSFASIAPFRSVVIAVGCGSIAT